MLTKFLSFAPLAIPLMIALTFVMIVGGGLWLRRKWARRKPYYITKTLLGNLYGVDFPDGRQARMDVQGDRLLALRIYDRQREEIVLPCFAAKLDLKNDRFIMEIREMPSEEVRYYLDHLTKYNYGEPWVQDIQTLLE